MISTGSASAFIDDLFKIINKEDEEKIQWEFFLHKVFNETWGDFKSRLTTAENEPENDVDLGEVFVKNMNMINNFKPDCEVV